MKYIKILSFVALAAIAAACNKQEYPAFEFGPADVSDGKTVVYFVTNSANEELEPTDETYTIAVARTNASGALSVPVKVFNPSEVFTVPASIEFADGEEETTLVVDITKMELETPYELTVSIPNDYFYSYKADSPESAKNTFHMEVLKQKWNDAGSCTFYDGTWFGKLVSVDNIKIQNHEGTDDYRIVNPYNSLSAEDFGTGNIVFSVKDNKSVVFKEGILDFWPGSGYYCYWDVTNYSKYCNVKLSKQGDAVTVEVNSLITNDAGSLFTGGYFAFIWAGGPLEV